MDDIVPALLENIQSQFDEKTYNSAKLKKALKRLSDKKATYIDVNDFAIEVGEISADVLGANITAEILPDGKMYFNIADRILNPTMRKNFDLVSGYAGDVQRELNQAAGIKLKAQSPVINQDRIDGIINRVSSEADFEAIKWILQEPVVNFTQSIVDDAIKANVDFHAKAGLQPTITRTVRGKACDWCKNLAGTYPYHEEPENVYQRHDRCRCTVEYNPKDSRGIQNSHSKKWRDPQKDAKIEARKLLNLDSPSYTGPSGVSAIKRGKIHPDALPNWQNAKIDKQKFEKYFLDPNHSRGSAKAKELNNVLGLNPKNYRMVANQIKKQLPYYKAIPSYEDQWGKRYVVMMPVTGPNGKTTNLLTFWIDEGGKEVRFTNAYRAHEKDRRKYK
ncbi:DUF6883 domain-containing protein [Enterococcus asini]|uniref:DUF6883 domain-containing protein n=1 Tax=Enterococcus asini TaxID=57732 RepID=UPI0022E076C0|nr:DUF6883 domain-containing protein [Enterococcus asini]